MPRLLGNIHWARRLFTRGARPDIHPGVRPETDWEDASMMRPTSVDGDMGALESVGGEQVLFTPDPGEEGIAFQYVCIGTQQAGTRQTSWWASPTPGFYPKLKIGGVTMAESPLIPYRYDRPLQFANLDRRQGTILFPADGESDSLFWDIEEIVRLYNAGEQTYFGQFDPQAISVSLAGPLEWPQHTGNPDIGTGAPVGKYIFWLGYVDKNGNRSNGGPTSLPIDVAAVQAPIYLSPDGQYPGGQTTGGQANPDTLIPTPYGIRLRWQVDNRLDYSLMELFCQRFNEGGELNGAGTVEVVARIPMVPDEFGYTEFIYPRDNNFLEVIPPDQVQQEQVNFTAAKAADYVNNRLVYANFELKDRLIELEFQSVDGSRTFPFTDRVFTRYGGEEYNDGFSDPVNNTYKKSAQHGDKYTPGIMVWDGNTARSFVVTVQENVQMPGRSDRKTADSLSYSSDPLYRTISECQSDDPVAPSFDAIKQGSTPKTYDQFTNVIDGLNYNPFRPYSPTDGNFVRYRMAPVEAWQTNASGPPIPNTGACFANEVHSLGLGVYGPENLDEQAPWWRILSPMLAPPAGRVIVSGMAVYNVETANAIINTRVKTANELRCFFPDFDSFVVPQAIQDDVANNPQNYRLRFTPYGFHSEIYSYRTDATLPGPVFRSRALDLISYMNIQYDPGTGQIGSVNNGEPPGQMGVQPSFSAPPFPTNYAGYPAYRRLTADIPPPITDVNDPNYLIFMDPNNAQQGAFEVSFNLFYRQQEGRGGIWRLRCEEAPYRTGSSNSGQHFDDTATRRAHEAFWIVDLIRPEAEVPSANVQDFVLGGEHILRERCIGLFTPNDQGVNDLEMFHARPFDAIGRFPTTQRYAYVRAGVEPEQRWLCATGNQVVADNLATIIADINANGFWVDPDGNQVFGLYESFVDINSGPHPITYLKFGSFTEIPGPPAGARIVVKYDKREPILYQGFDCTISPSAWAPFDRTFNAAAGLGNDDGNTQAFTGFPLPYGGGIRSENYVLPRNGSDSAPATIEVRLIENLTSIRQWIIMGDVVSRTPKRLDTGGGNAVRYAFPRTHYIIRPSLLAGYDSGNQNGLNPQYDIDYPGEGPWLSMGGFRFKSEYNLEYAHSTPVTGKGVPQNGQDPKTLFPTGFIASEVFDPLAQDKPGYRTFSFDNLFVASEENGEVKLVASLDQNGLQSLWALAEKGIFNVPYNRQVLTDADGNTIGTQSVSNFWPRQELWIARGTHGSPDQFWRMAVKANSPAGNSDRDTLFWVDRVSAYMLQGGAIVDVARGKYQKYLLPVLKETPGDYRRGYASVYNRRNNEWWIVTLSPGASDGTNFGRPENTLFVFNALSQEWTGRFIYEYDQYLNIGSDVYGMRALGTNTLNEGDTMLTAEGTIPIRCSVITSFFPNPHAYKEAMRWRVVGNLPDIYTADPDYAPFAPVQVEVYDAQMRLLSVMNEANSGTAWYKHYDGLEGWVDRLLESLNTSRPLPQSQGFYIRVVYNTLGPKTLFSVQMQIKEIR